MKSAERHLNRFTPEGEPAQKGACPLVQSCEMFELLQDAGMLRTWQIRYCSGDFRQCARLRTSERGEPVPQNLMPNGQLLRFSGPRQKR